MSLFFLGFFSAIAVLAVTVIVWAVVAYRRQERKRQAGVDAIMAKVVQPTGPDAEFVTHRKFTDAEIAFLEREWERHYTGPKLPNPQGKKGIH